MTVGKFIGCVMMVVGSAIGAGILAMPMVSAFAGFTCTVMVILGLWVLLTVSGLLVVEVSSALPAEACSFNSMAEKTLGSYGKTITWFSYLLLLYSTLAAYIAGESDLIFNILRSTSLVQLPSWLIATLFTATLGSIVFWSTKAVDHFNRGLITLKGFLLVTTLILTVVFINSNNLLTGQSISQIKYVVGAAPVLLCLFNYHFVIPSLRIYVGDNPKALRWIIISGTTVSLVIYLLWLAATLGTVPLEGDNSFASIASSQGSVGEFIKVLTSIINNSWVTVSIKSFANISMTTSFLGVSLGLFDFLADGFKRPNTKLGRLQTAGLTFVPPFLFALFYPKGFVMALSYSAVFIAILCLVLPAVMVYRLRNNPEIITTYRAACGNKSFVLIIIIGLVFSTFPILGGLGLLQVVT